MLHLYCDNGNLRKPVILTPYAERLALELSLPALPTQFCGGWTFRMRSERFNPLRHRRGGLKLTRPQKWQLK